MSLRRPQELFKVLKINCRSSHYLQYSCRKTISSTRFAGNGGSEEPHIKTTGLPEITKEIEQECNTDVPEEELRARKTASIMNWLESRYGREKVALAKLLQDHQVVVRGGREDGLKLLEALLVGSKTPPECKILDTEALNEWKQQEL